MSVKISLYDSERKLEHIANYYLEFIPDHIIWGNNCYHLTSSSDNTAEYESNGSCITL